jgi:hypothetical protein
MVLAYEITATIISSFMGIRKHLVTVHSSRCSSRSWWIFIWLVSCALTAEGTYWL